MLSCDIPCRRTGPNDPLAAALEMTFPVTGRVYIL